MQLDYQIRLEQNRKSFFPAAFSSKTKTPYNQTEFRGTHTSITISFAVHLKIKYPHPLKEIYIIFIPSGDILQYI